MEDVKVESKKIRYRCEIMEGKIMEIIHVR